MRRLPEERPGDEATVRLAAGHDADRADRGVGQGASLYDKLPGVPCNGREPDVTRGIPCMEAAGRFRLQTDAGAGGGGDFHFGERKHLREQEKDGEGQWQPNILRTY